MGNRNLKNVSAKQCPGCGKQGLCKDSRHGDGYIRRLYKCACGEKWTTAEFLVDRNATPHPYKVKNFRAKMAEAAGIKTVELAIKKLQELL